MYIQGMFRNKNTGQNNFNTVYTREVVKKNILETVVLCLAAFDRAGQGTLEPGTLSPPTRAMIEEFIFVAVCTRAAKSGEYKTVG
jgi:hypothetical protein